MSLAVKPCSQTWVTFPDRQSRPVSSPAATAETPPRSALQGEFAQCEITLILLQNALTHQKSMRGLRPLSPLYNRPGYDNVGLARPFPCLQFVTLSLILPSCLLTYLGQGAYMLRHPEGYSNPYFNATPQWAFWPVLIIATLASIVSAQSLISGKLLPSPLPSCRLFSELLQVSLVVIWPLACPPSKLVRCHCTAISYHN